VIRLAQETNIKSSDKADGKEAKNPGLEGSTKWEPWMMKIDTEMQKEFLSGRMIEPINLWKDMKVSDLVNTYAGMGFNARRLAEACDLFLKMIDEDVTICLTVAGAMTPIGMSGLLIKAMDYGFVDWIVTTGANCYHDTHRAFGFPMVQGDFRVDDNELHKTRIARIYDVFIDDDDTLISTDKCIINAFRMRGGLEPPFSTPDVYERIGREMQKAAPYPEKSFMVTAAEKQVPIFVPSQADSSIGMNLIINYIDGEAVDPSPSLDILESAAIVKFAEKNGAIELGGGVPKNFFMQTQPTLWQILYDNKGGHDYFIQITDARPDTGGLSGATPAEAKSWGKVADADRDNVVVYCDSSIAAPLLFAHAISQRGPRKHKRLMSKKDKFTKDLIEAYKDKFKDRDDAMLDKYVAKPK
jgi:deoxyhypusine synthase